MVAPLIGAPAFVARLIRLYSISADLLFDQIVKLIGIIHDCSSFVFLVMSGNLRANQKCSQLFHDTYKSHSACTVSHPIRNTQFNYLYLLFDPTHLFKNIKNNCLTEKMQKLKFTDPESKKTVVASFANIAHLFRDEEDSAIKLTNLTYATIYSTNFDKQKVKHTINVFNEKTVAAMKIKQFEDTCIFVEEATQLWHMLNVKSTNYGTQLHDAERYPFTSIVDLRYIFIEEMATEFRNMNTFLTPYPTLVMTLTNDTSEARYLTLQGIVSITIILLEKGANYVLTGTFQSDRLEGEFGIYRQQSGGNQYISVE